jgi:DNA modification methylase
MSETNGNSGEFWTSELPPIEEDVETNPQNIGDRVGKNGIWLGNQKGIYDERNTLNDLTGKEWLQLSKSVWTSERCVDDKVAFNHPAPFLIRDIEKLISLFTKKGDIVLDPFLGSGTTLVSAARQKRNGIGIELNQTYVKDLVFPRLDQHSSERYAKQHNLFSMNNDELIIGGRKISEDTLSERNQFYSSLQNSENGFLIKTQDDCALSVLIGDSGKRIQDIPAIDYCVTSPPYHNILKNQGKGVRHDGSQTRQGIEYYSDDPNDLGNFDEYDQYLESFSKIMGQVYDKLQAGRYCTIIVSDFTVNKREMNVHGNIIDFMINQLKYKFVGNTILVQDSKTLYPFGYPYQYRINHVHQYLLSFLKD